MLIIVFQLPTVFSTVTCCTGLQPRSNRLCHRAWVCSGLDHPPICVNTSVIFAQRGNHLTTHFSKGIPILKRHITVVLFCVSAKDAQSIIMRVNIALRG